MKKKSDTTAVRRSEKQITVAAVLSGRYEYDEALEKARRWIGQAARSGARYICFPEYYFDQDRGADGSLSRGAADDGPLAGELARLAEKHRMAIVAGITEKVRNRRFELWDYYNTALFVDETGVRGKQRKVFLWVDPEWDEERIFPGNEGDKLYPYPPVCDERKKFLPGWSFEALAFGDLERVCGLICADGLMPPSWSHIIPQSPQAVFYPNGRINLLKQWGPDLGDLCKRHGIPVVASNSCPQAEAAVFDSDGRLAASIEGTEGIAVARITPGRKQPHQPVGLRHWDGDPLEMLNRLYKA